jgi:high-affinity Fe2+/Pb2+ permease
MSILVQQEKVISQDELDEFFDDLEFSDHGRSINVPIGCGIVIGLIISLVVGMLVYSL